jgi:hypothetical protein
MSFFLALTNVNNFARPNSSCSVKQLFLDGAVMRYFVLVNRDNDYAQ